MPMPPTQVLSTTTKVQERSAAGYVRLDLASANERLRGNFGVRYVITQEASSGYVPTPDAKLVYGFFGANTLGYTDAALQAITVVVPTVWQVMVMVGGVPPPPPPPQVTPTAVKAAVALATL